MFIYKKNYTIMSNLLLNDGFMVGLVVGDVDGFVVTDAFFF